VCRGGPSVFYPSAPESDEQRLLRVARAKSICATCPVRTPCLGYALRLREPLGIWGGLTESERRTVTGRN